MKNLRSSFPAGILAVLLSAASFWCGSATGGESVWDGSFWDAADNGAERADDKAASRMMSS